MANSAFDHSPTITVPGSSTNTALVRWSSTGADTFLDSTLLLSTSATPTLGITADPDLLTFGNGTIAITGTITGVTTITATTFSGALSGNASGSAATLTNARTIGGTSFNGSANIVPATITVADTTDTSSYVGLWESATGDLPPKTDAALTYNAGTGALTAVTFHGSGANLTNLPSGGVDTTGTPANNQIAIFTDADTLEGVSGLTYTSSTLTLSGSADQVLKVSGTSSNEAQVLIDAASSGTARISWQSAGTTQYSWNWSDPDNKFNLWSTNIDGSGGNGDVIRIDDGTDDVKIVSGNLIIGTAGKGIDFSAQADEATGETMTAELLDFYEEGSFIPRISMYANIGSSTASHSSTTKGTYVRIGKMCYFQIYLSLDHSAGGLGSESGDAIISPLPFTASDREIAINVGYIESMAITAGMDVGGYINANTTRMRLRLSDHANGQSNLQLSEFSSDGQIFLNGCYEVA